jgi:hypothetical protein
MLPSARKDELVVRDLPDETLVYDLKRHKAHCLNRTAALVWRSCDGRTTTAEIAGRLGEATGMAGDEEVVRLALEGLGRAHLLQERVARAGDGVRVSRRDVARRLGLTAGLTALLPVVMSIVAPTPAEAGSCIAAGVSCETGAHGKAVCCPGCQCTGNSGFKFCTGTC